MFVEKKNPKVSNRKCLENCTELKKSLIFQFFYIFFELFPNSLSVLCAGLILTHLDKALASTLHRVSMASRTTAPPPKANPKASSSVPASTKPVPVTVNEMVDQSLPVRFFYRPDSASDD